MFVKCSLILVVCMWTRLTSSSLYDPHVFPDEGPFFEGWYTRFIGTNNTAAVLFGKVLPQSDGSTTLPLAQVTILLSQGGKLQSWSVNIAPKSISITSNGKPVQNDPELHTQPDFAWTAQNVGFYNTTGQEVNFQFNTGEIIIKGQIALQRQYRSDGEGPEGILSRGKILPLNWFVYSLSSEIKDLQIVNTTSHVSLLTLKSGFAHLEKNWGMSFPSAWVWSQGTSADGNVAFGFSGGPLDIFGVGVPGRLLGYRNYRKGIEIDFPPYSSLVQLEPNGCGGRATISAHSVTHTLKINISATTNTFSSCILGPGKEGFSPMCQETFEADAHISLYSTLFGDEIDKQTVKNVGLEFGGTYQCNPCTHLLS